MDAVIFDLDGTLWDTCVPVAVAWNNVLTRNNIDFRPIHADDLRAVTGRTHAECVDTVFASLPKETRKTICEETMAADNEIVREKGGRLYPDVIDGLNALAGRYSLCIVSNCQSGYIESFLDSVALHHLFADFECWGNTNATKAKNLEAVIRRNDFAVPVFVGDTMGDMEAALSCGVPFIQVTYGFGAEISGADKVHEFSGLVKRLMSP